MQSVQRYICHLPLRPNYRLASTVSSSPLLAQSLSLVCACGRGNCLLCPGGPSAGRCASPAASALQCCCGPCCHCLRKALRRTTHVMDMKRYPTEYECKQYVVAAQDSTYATLLLIIPVIRMVSWCCCGEGLFAPCCSWCSFTRVLLLLKQVLRATATYVHTKTCLSQANL
jgi:hypothetical protein